MWALTWQLICYTQYTRSMVLVVFSLCAIFAPLPQYAHAENASFLEGHVTDDLGNPVANAQWLVLAGFGRESRGETDGVGRFRVGPYSHGTRLFLSVSAPGHRTSVSDDILAPYNDLRVVLDRRGAIRGAVSDAETGQPVDRFTLVFHRIPGVLTSAEFPGSREFSSKAGEFFWPQFMPGVWSFSIYAPGYVPKHIYKYRVPPGSEAESLSLKLHKGRSLSGLIVDHDSGAPVEDVEVTLLDSELTIAERRHQRRDRTSPRARTDRKGQFEFREVPTNQFSIVVSAEGYSNQDNLVLDGSMENPVRISLRRGMTLNVHVTEATGQPSGDALVTLWNGRTSEGISHPVNKEGYATFQNIPEGTYLLSARSAAGLVRAREIEVAGDQAGANFQLQLLDSPRVNGRVTGLLPGEVGRTSVTVIGPNEFFAASEVANDGTYAIAGTPGGSLTIFAQTPLGRQATKYLDTSGKDDLSVDFAFPSSARVFGRIQSEGRAVRNATVDIKSHPANEILVQAETSQSGQYVADGVPIGLLTLGVQGRGTNSVVNLLADMRVDFDIPSATVGGIAQNGSEPVGGVQLLLQSDAQLEAATRVETVTSVDGSYNFVGLSPGQYTLAAYKPGYGYSAKPVAVGAQPIRNDIVMVPGVGIPVRILDSRSRQPITRLYLDIWEPQFRSIRLVIEPAADGTAVLPRGVVGKALSFHWFGFEPTYISNWDEQLREVLLVANRD